MDSNIFKLNKIKQILFVWIISSLCYIPIISNGYVNSIDGIWHSSTYFQAGNWKLSIGRWAWLFLDKFKGSYAAEPFSTLVSLLLISIGVCIAINLIIDFDYCHIPLALIFTISTSTCCYISYRYMSPTF